MKLQVYLQKATTVTPDIPTKTQFTHWIKQVLLTTKPSCLNPPYSHIETTIRLVDLPESAQFNERYRYKSGPTNILSFVATNIPENQVYYLGDLLICAPLVALEAQEQNKINIAHWAHLTLHGTLHLLGYDHLLTPEAQIMESLETTIMQKLGFADPYIFHHG